MSFQSRLSPRVCDPDYETRRYLVRKAAASLFLSIAGGAAEQPEGFVSDVENAMETNLRGVSR
jgi:hypothetical protein